MNGLDYIIGQIDDSIETFYESDIKSYGICRQEQKDDTVIPVKYNGRGEYEPLDFNYSAWTYHRLIDQTEDVDPDSGFGNNTYRTEVYSISLVFWSEDLLESTYDSSYKIANEIKSLIPNRLTKVQLENINAVSGIISNVGVSHDRRQIFEDELGDFRLNPDNILFKIDYTIEVTFNASCYTLTCAVETPLINIQKATDANLIDSEFGLTDNQKEVVLSTIPCSLLTLENLTDTQESCLTDLLCSEKAAAFTVDDTTPDTGEEITFTDESIGSPSTW